MLNLELRISNLVLLFLLLLWSRQATPTTTLNRFQYSGDGLLVLHGQSIRFRSEEGSYDETGLKKIHTIFNAPWEVPEERLSLRFIEVLDYVQDQLQGKSYQLKSGYRSPGLNQSLRNQGKLAAQSSMHTEGAAGDLFLVGVPSSEVFGYVKSLNCCGIGWYHSRHFHLDTGPARYWDEATSKTEDKTPQQNEKIILQPDYDRYSPGEVMDLKFMRVTQYPIGIPVAFSLVKVQSEQVSKRADLEIQFPSEVQKQSECLIFTNRDQARKLRLTLPSKNLEPGNYALKIQFCNRYNYEKMPTEILSRQFEIIRPSPLSPRPSILKGGS